MLLFAQDADAAITAWSSVCPWWFAPLGEGWTVAWPDPGAAPSFIYEHLQTAAKTVSGTMLVVPDGDGDLLAIMLYAGGRYRSHWRLGPGEERRDARARGKRFTKALAGLDGSVQLTAGIAVLSSFDPAGAEHWDADQLYERFLEAAGLSPDFLRYDFGMLESEPQPGFTRAGGAVAPPPARNTMDESESLEAFRAEHAAHDALRASFLFDMREVEARHAYPDHWSPELEALAHDALASTNDIYRRTTREVFSGVPELTRTIRDYARDWKSGMRALDHLIGNPRLPPAKWLDTAIHGMSMSLLVVLPRERAMEIVSPILGCVRST
ncbi:MAG: hypothetical protein ABIY52_01540 [Gemmatimonadaceae bacterium]